MVPKRKRLAMDRAKCPSSVGCALTLAWLDLRPGYIYMFCSESVCQAWSGLVFLMKMDGPTNATSNTTGFRRRGLLEDGDEDMDLCA